VSDREINLYLIGDDPILQLGLETAFADDPKIRVILRTSPSLAVGELGSQAEGDRVSIALLEWPLHADPNLRLQLGDRLQHALPGLKIVVLCDPIEPQFLAAAQAIPLQGYCAKGSSLDRIRTTLYRVAAGQNDWPNFPTRPARVKASYTSRWLYRNAQGGLTQIDQQLAHIAQQLDAENLPLLDWLFWTGRRRELKVARAIVAQLLPTYILPDADEPPPPPPPSEPTALAPQPPQQSSALSVPQSLFERLRSQLQIPPVNATGTTLALDILKPDKQRELLYLVLRKTQTVLEELRLLVLPAEELARRRSPILREIWQTATLDFYNTYYTSGQADDLIVDVVMQDAATIQRTLLDQIPFVSELFAYLLFDTALTIDEVAYRSESPEAQARAQLLLDNLILRIANGIMQFLLNHFAELERVKERLYDRRYWSSRQIARLRNELSWQYRQEIYFEDPIAMFESRHSLLTLNGNAIAIATISVSRLGELNQLKGLPWLVTILLESRDAIAPRARAVIAFLGRGVIYLLVQVIGRGIGLIGRGILQGFGNALQETRYGKRR
jgi:DNA-binding NarL/FixJ family response regulator